MALIRLARAHAAAWARYAGLIWAAHLVYVTRVQPDRMPRLSLGVSEGQELIGYLHRHQDVRRQLSLVVLLGPAHCHPLRQGTAKLLIINLPYQAQPSKDDGTD